MSHDKSTHYRSKYSSKLKEETNLCDFSFLKFKHIFGRFLISHHDNKEIIQNLADFWAFIAKYENMLKAAGKPILPTPMILKESGDMTTFNKRLFTFIDVDIDKDRIISDLSRCKELPNNFSYKTDQFLEILLLYLDFKQKDKFQKLKKLRIVQKSLPVYGYKEKIISSINQHQVVIIAGDTGCGKSTQIPQYLHEMGYKNIACSQPRRLACVSLSKRVAHEMLEDYGSTVGYQIRFERSKTSKTKICFITEGLLLRQLALDANLFNYDALILDEIHERNLYGDILLGVVKCLVRARRDFKLILMSATINVDLFTNYFQEEDISYLEVPGRLYPIKVFYMPPHSLQLKGPSSKSNRANRLDPEPYIQILSIIDNKYPKNEKGDLLVFVSGVNEINTVIEAAKQYNETSNNWIILPLHSGLSLADQDKVFDYSPDGLRKCIVSTNIAETSLTIDGIRFVVDSGKVKEMLFDSSCKIQRLKEFLVSKSSAEQRKGRAGRTGPGTCYRLYSQQDFDNFEAYPIPEIHRVSLESILLQMMAMGLPDVRIFPFIEVPANENIEQAIRVLKQHEALTQNEKITSLGRALSALPVEITIGKMLLMSCVFRELNRALTFSAILSIQSPYTSRAFTDPKCERSRSTLRSDQGDPFTAINLYREWLELKWNKKSSTRKWCYTMGVEEQRFYELTKLRNQFANALENCNIIDTKSNEFTSSAEKSIRYGEVRLLKAMKRSQIMLAPTRRKVLKRDSETFESLDDLGDIRDVDFRLKNDSNQLRMLLISAKAEKRKDILMLKLIIVSGFYPQIAIPDEFNFCQSESQQFFHTVSKPFVSLHPNSNFANCCDKLRLRESDIVEKPIYYNSRLQLSSAHQILCYQTLLETTKAYLINTIRMPAAQTLLLFSFTIDTNALVTHIVCDSWLSLEFPTPGSGQELLLTAIRLRRLWQKLLTEKLNGMQEGEKIDIEEKTDDYFDQDQLLNDLVDFMNFNIIYTIKRLLPGELKDLYTLTEINQECFIPNPFAKDFEVSANLEKGGLNVSENVVYGCLKEAPWNTVMQELAKNYNSHCNVCDITISNLGIERISHANDCLQKDTNKKINTSSTSDGRSTNLNSFFCSTCKRNLTLSKINILKHKSKCRTASK